MITFQIIDWNMRTSQELGFRWITTSKNNFSKISHIPSNALRFPLCPINLSLSLRALSNMLQRTEMTRPISTIIGSTMKPPYKEHQRSTLVTWDRALFSFRLTNKILAGKAKRTTANQIVWHCLNDQSALRLKSGRSSTSVRDFVSGPILARPLKREYMEAAKIGPDLRLPHWRVSHFKEARTTCLKILSFRPKDTDSP